MVIKWSPKVRLGPEAERIVNLLVRGTLKVFIGGLRGGVMIASVGCVVQFVNRLRLSPMSSDLSWSTPVETSPRLMVARSRVVDASIRATLAPS